MSFRSHGTSNEDLVDQLKKNNVLKSPRVEEAMRRVDRKNYCPSDPYRDCPSYIGYGVNISGQSLVQSHRVYTLCVILTYILVYSMLVFSTIT